MEGLKGNINEDFESLIKLFEGLDVKYLKDLLNQIGMNLDNHCVVTPKRFEKDS